MGLHLTPTHLIENDWLVDWLILAAWQPPWHYFMLRGEGIAYIVHLYYCVVSEAFWTGLYDTKYFYQIK